MDAVTAGLRTNIDDRVAGSGGCRPEDAVAVGKAYRHGVNQYVAVIGGVEIDLTAYGRNADTVSIPANAGHDARQKMACFLMVRGAEAKRVQKRDRSCAHGEDVAQDSANARCRSLVGFDE